MVGHDKEIRMGRGFVRIPVDDPMNEFENLQLMVVQGWRDN